MKTAKLKSVLINEHGDISHHAYLIEGERETIIAELFEFFKSELNVEIQRNPDFLHLSFETFGIDDGRKLKEMQSGKAFMGGRRLFIITATSITHEAQNSLLKVFEDPSPNVHFFLVLSSVEGILPTLRSRFLIIEHTSKHKTRKSPTQKSISSVEFLSSSKASRLMMIKGIVDEKNKDRAFVLLNDIEAELHAKLITSIGTQLKKGNSEEIVSILEEITRSREYLHDRSSSIKLVLEHIALIAP